jgi:hypothetical protein
MPRAAKAKRASLPAVAPPQTLFPLTPQYFGMHIDVQALPGGNPPLAWPTFPFGTIRMNSTKTRWDQIEATQGTYDFTTLDQWRTLYQQNEAGNPAGDYQIIFTIYSVPAFYSSDPSNSCAFNSESGHPVGSCYPPTDIAANCTNNNGLNDCDGNSDGTDASFINFLTALVTHVQNDSLPKIQYWEVWNEPNDITFWNGTTAQLARMAQDARCVIVGGTACNPNGAYTLTGIAAATGAKMLTPPPVTSSDETDTALNSPSGWLSTYLPLGGAYADFIGFHGYVEPTDPVEDVLTTAETIEPAVAAAGFSSTPIWDTEIGFPTANVCDPDSQAGWLAKAYLLQAGLGIQRVAWFEYGAVNVGTLTLPSGAEDTAGTDYTNLYNWLEGATPTGTCSSSGNSGTIWSCGFTLANQAQAMAVWDSSQSCTQANNAENCTFSPFNVPTSPSFSSYLDLQGGTHSVSGATVQIGIEPILLVTQ